MTDQPRRRDIQDVDDVLARVQREQVAADAARVNRSALGAVGDAVGSAVRSGAVSWALLGASAATYLPAAADAVAAGGERLLDASGLDDPAGRATTPAEAPEPAPAAETADQLDQPDLGGDFGGMADGSSMYGYY